MKRISLDDPDEFTLAYLKVFRNFTNSTVVGTSLTDKNYFWTTYDEKNNSVENEIFSFTSSGGKIKRFFYLSEENIKDERTVKVLKKQKEILGVDVWVVKDQKAPRKLFVYCAEKEFGWTAIIDNETKKLKNFIFTKNESDLLEFKITSEKLESIFAIKWDAKVDLKQL
ncbi:MAG: hypothetical protein IPK08_22305 [Bacteroidetes bacterium]|nr:hypothetical protein [Bacteroidota bacterium]